jgi:phage FluMu protein Com
MHKCPQCKTLMEAKGEASDDGDIIVYQCPKCKNVEFYSAYCDSQFRMSYP